LIILYVYKCRLWLWLSDTIIDHPLCWLFNESFFTFYLLFCWSIFEKL